MYTKKKAAPDPQLEITYTPLKSIAHYPNLPPLYKLKYSVMMALRATKGVRKMNERTYTFKEIADLVESITEDAGIDPECYNVSELLGYLYDKHDTLLTITING